MPTQADDPYAQIARWYDLEHDALTDDLDCYTSLLETPPGGRAQVLEVGSGSGRIAAALAVAGFQVVGIEPSAAMRERSVARFARLPERIARRAQSVAGSATALGIAPGDRFDAVLFGQGTFAHLLSPEERLAALTQLRAHLKPQGQLLLDLDLLGPRRLLETSGQLWWQGTWEDASATQVSHFVVGSAGATPGVLQVTHFYDSHGQDAAVQRTIARMSLALLTYGEIALTLTQSGYTIEAAYGGYDLAPYEDHSPRVLLVARPRNSDS